MKNLVIQIATHAALIPKHSELRLWVQQALKNRVESYEITLRIVEEEEMRRLNASYRGKNYATNVLSFPHVDHPLIGDIVICASVVKQEADIYQKPVLLHWAHMVVHGLFHLQGHDHIEETEAQTMQALEIKILNELGFANPYEEEVRK